MYKIQRILSLANSIAKVKFFHRRIPLFVAWELTNRCNLQCGYCDSSRIKSDELPTHKILSMIDELKFLGTEFICFTGGEPLLRQDLAEIIDYCKNRFIHTSINTNGFNLKERFSYIRNANLIILSLDGQENVHDSIRGKGSFRQVLEAAEIIRKEDIELNFAATLTGLNSDQIDFLIGKAHEYGATITFQPALNNVLFTDRRNYLCASQKINKETMEDIIDYKKRLKGNTITNSFTALRHFCHWPDKKRIRCASGYITCRIKSNGDVCLCNNPRYNKIGSYSSLKTGIKDAFYNLPLMWCDECWCAQRLEANFLFDLNWEVIFNNLALVIRKA